MKKYTTFLTLFVIYILLNMIILPQLYIRVTLDGISAWAFNVLPSILPFLFFTKILSLLGGIDKLCAIFARPCKKLFSTPAISSYAFFMSVVSGYPVGAKVTADLYQQGKITRQDAFKMTSFCSTSGPMFILGAVGIGMLSSARVGYIILISHILGAITNGILYRKIKTKEEFSPQDFSARQRQDLSSIVVDTIMSILSIGVIIAIFFVVISSLSPLFNILPAPLSSVLEGMVEITKGCIDLSSFENEKVATLLCSFVIGFGGISTILQSMTMLEKIKMPVRIFVLQKFTHAVLSCLFCLCLLPIL